MARDASAVWTPRSDIQKMTLLNERHEGITMFIRNSLIGTCPNQPHASLAPIPTSKADTSKYEKRAYKKQTHGAAALDSSE